MQDTGRSPTLLEEVVAEVEYRNHQLLVVEWGSQVLHKGACMTNQQLVVRFMEEDADDPRKPAKLYEWKAPCPDFAVKDRETCLRWVFEMLVRNEVHEMAEFFKYKSGGRPFCPHSGPFPSTRLTWPGSTAGMDT